MPSKILADASKYKLNKVKKCLHENGFRLINSSYDKPAVYQFWGHANGRNAILQTIELPEMGGEIQFDLFLAADTSNTMDGLFEAIEKAGRTPSE